MAPREINYIDRDPLNNRYDNLRLAIRSENCQNRGEFKNNTIGVKGVYYMKKYDKWHAKISVNGKQIFLKSCYTKEEAITIRKETEKLY